MNPHEDKIRIRYLRTTQSTNHDELAGRYRLRPGRMELRPVQRRALQAIERTGGMLGSIGVGHGKTLIAALAPMAARVHVGRPVTALLLVPASMVAPTLRERDAYRSDGWNVQECEIASYARLSQRDGRDWLYELDPDLVILDEAHRVRDYSAARTRRLDRYVDETGPLVVAMSGTLTTRRVADYAHLAKWSLGGKSPLPLTHSGVAHTDAVIQSATAREGAATTGDWYWFRGAYGDGPPREALQAALEASGGTVLTSDAGCTASLVIEELEAWDTWSPELETLETLWELPDGTMLDSPMHVARHRAHLELGFWYRWRWETWGWDDVEAYMAARAQWGKRVRDWCTSRTAMTEGTETPALLRDAIERDPDHPLRAAWHAWAPYADRELPEVEAVWVHRRALEWIKRQEVESVWVQSRATQDALPDAYSVKVHGTGHNLQHLASALVVEPPSNGAAWEQLLGRLHRSGQQADVVRFAVPATDVCTERLSKAAADAKYIEETTGSRQRLNFATRVR